VTDRFLALYGRPGDEDMVVRGAGVTDGTGSAVVELGPPPREHVWIVSRIRVWTDATVLQPTAVVYRLTPYDPIPSAATAIAGTTTGSGDVAEGSPEVVSHPATLRVEWADGDPSVQVGVSLELIQRPMRS